MYPEGDRERGRERGINVQFIKQNDTRLPSDIFDQTNASGHVKTQQLLTPKLLIQLNT